MNQDYYAYEKDFKDLDPSALPFRQRHWFVKILNNSFYDLPCPYNLNAWWRFGSILGLCIAIQFYTGFALSIHYTAHESLAFDSCIHIIRNVKKGWLLRNMHANGASMFFICIYIHIARGIYYGSFLDKSVWNVGIILYFLVIAESFLGYTLPWGQISYWGAVVITNLVTVIPYYGKTIKIYVLGGWTVGNNTLKRFYSFHFLIPFIIIVFAMLHLFYLHEKGSNNPLGIERDTLLVSFHPVYRVKDLFGFVCFFLVFIYLRIWNPDLLGNKLNFIPANYYKTPKKISPEWYFIWAYAILRCIPHKTGGIICIFSAIAILFFLPFLHYGKYQSLCFYPINQVIFWILITRFIRLTWIGSRPPYDSYNTIGQFYTILYFFIIISLHPSTVMWDKLIRP